MEANPKREDVHPPLKQDLVVEGTRVRRKALLSLHHLEFREKRLTHLHCSFLQVLVIVVILLQLVLLVLKVLLVLVQVALNL